MPSQFRPQYTAWCTVLICSELLPARSGPGRVQCTHTPQMLAPNLLEAHEAVKYTVSFSPEKGKGDEVGRSIQAQEGEWRAQRESFTENPFPLQNKRS